MALNHFTIMRYSASLICPAALIVSRKQTRSLYTERSIRRTEEEEEEVSRLLR